MWVTTTTALPWRAPHLAVVPEVHVGAVVEALVRLVEQQHGGSASSASARLSFWRVPPDRSRVHGALAQRIAELGEDLPAAAQHFAWGRPAPRPNITRWSSAVSRSNRPVACGQYPMGPPTADLAGVGAKQPGADPQQRGLAGAVLAGQCDDLAGAHVEVDASRTVVRPKRLDTPRAAS